MRQVPHYLLIGNGRLARHFQHYFSLLNLSFVTWNRKAPLDQLFAHLKHTTHILLLISDQAIEAFIFQYLQNTQAKLIHCSGSLVSQHAYGAHPLMTFNQTLYDLKHYSALPFIVDQEAPDFKDLLPGLPNKFFKIPAALKPKYHALCVLSGNFSCLLWTKLFSSFEKEFNFPAEIAFPYLLQQTQNLITDYKNSLTGPLVRNDVETLTRNINALSNDEFQTIFKSFVNSYQKIKAEIDS